MKIDFIGIGTFKAGTTWIVECLREHPEVCVPSIKEINFFNKMYDHDTGKKLYYNYEKGLNWYFSQFNECKNSSIKGEFSNYYLYDENTPKLIKKHFPQAKLILSLREPSERAYSHYLWDKLNFGKAKNLNFSEILKDKSNVYIEMGKYDKYLKSYYDVFDKNQILIITLDEIKNTPETAIKKVYSHIGAEDVDFLPPSLRKKVNPAVESRFKFLIKVFDLRIFMEKNNMGFLIDLLKEVGLYSLLQNLYIKINRKEHKKDSKKISEYEKCSEELKQYYNQSILNLEKLTGRTFSSWKI